MVAPVMFRFSSEKVGYTSSLFGMLFVSGGFFQHIQDYGKDVRHVSCKKILSIDCFFHFFTWSERKCASLKKMKTTRTHCYFGYIYIYIFVETKGPFGIST